jgi:hypothetical protein
MLGSYPVTNVRSLKLLSVGNWNQALTWLNGAYSFLICRQRGDVGFWADRDILRRRTASVTNGAQRT